MPEDGTPCLAVVSRRIAAPTHAREERMIMISNRRMTACATVSCLALAACLSDDPVHAQGFDPQGMAAEALAQPFVGITVDGVRSPGLFAIEATDASTAPVIAAASAFLASLDDELRRRVRFPVDDMNVWRNWANIHSFPREGISLDEMSDVQRERAHALLRASLSAKGYETSRDIMRLNHHLAELVDNFEDYGEHLYWVTVLGDPSATEPWGWQIEGHHLIVNYFVLGDQVVMTPTFMGSEPTRAHSGLYAGVAILEAEEELALALMQTLSPAQRELALLGAKEGRSENRTEMFKDNQVIPFEGIPAGSLDEAQRAMLVDLIELYVDNLDEGHAAVKMQEVLTHLDETWFAWIGETGDDAVFYYRIHSPVILIEFDHQGPIALDGDGPSRNHVHTVVRTPNGNDYGADLLRQHIETFANDPEHGHHVE
ncbi:MAG: DUF3500 domain-containing protein [Alphaproteobacteria bacterium]